MEIKKFLKNVSFKLIRKEGDMKVAFTIVLIVLVFSSKELFANELNCSKMELMSITSMLIVQPIKNKYLKLVLKNRLWI